MRTLLSRSTKLALFVFAGLVLTIIGRIAPTEKVLATKDPDPENACLNSTDDNKDADLYISCGGFL